MDPNTPKSPPQGEARRRLLRGSVAAPAVLTLLSGRALAQASATCIVRQANSPVQGSAANASAYRSVRTWRLTKNSDPNKYTVWVFRNDLTALLPKPTNEVLTTFIGVGNNYVCIEDRDGGGPHSLGSQTSAVPVRDNFSFAATTNTVGVLFNSSGNITGVANYTNIGTALTTSCWNSFSRS